MRFHDNKKSQIIKLIGDKDIIADITNMLGNTDNELSLKNNNRYKWVRFI